MDSKTTISKPVILCVDDELNALVLRKMVLQKNGYEVLTANSPIDALEMIGRHRIDLVLSDQLMPEKTGTELARELKRINPDLPVVVISGVNELPRDAHYADLFISKVEGPLMMCEKIAAVLSERRIK